MRSSALALTVISAISMNAYADFYRYKDKEGKTIISYSLTREAIMAGYDIVSDQGFLIEQVAPPKIEDKNNENTTQREQDIRLLSTYGSIAELEASIIRAAQSRADELELLESKLSSARESLVSAEDLAGIEERKSGVVSQETLDELALIEQSVVFIEAQIVSFEQESVAINQRNEDQLVRLRSLLNR